VITREAIKNFVITITRFAEIFHALARAFRSAAKAAVKLKRSKAHAASDLHCGCVCA
jgi:hypothetical protein